MNVLDSPLEALAFNYESFGFFPFVNNLWTWIAVATAAVSFWRIRAIGEVSRCSEPSVSSPPPREDRASDKPSPLCEEEQQPASSPAPAKAPVQEIGATKGMKFSLHYEEVDEELTVTEEEDYSEESDGELTVTEENSDGGEEWWESWERLLRMRMGKTGWYRYQDLTELNGNVVRLWDGNYCRSWEERNRCCHPKRCVLW